MATQLMLDLRIGLDVFGSDERRVGRVAGVRADDFHLDRPLARDLYVPFDAVARVGESGVMLKVSSREVDTMPWRQTEFLPPPSESEDTHFGF